jgi:NitT/TauT family transport system substrate-binding protein
VRRRPILERQEPAEEFDLLLAEPRDIDDGFRSRKHGEQAQQKHLVKRIDHLAGLPGIWKIRKKSKKNKRFVVRCGSCPCFHRILRKIESEDHDRFSTSAVCHELLHPITLPGNTTQLDKVTLITDFGYNGRHAYFFDALDKGYYRDAGLEVKIVRGQGSVDAIRQVGVGNVMFGFADAGSLILACANDQIPVKLVAIVYSKPPQAIFCREDSGLKKPKNLESNAIANPAGGLIPDLFPAFAKAAKIDAQTVRWVVASSESLPGLLATNKVPCVDQFTVGEPLLRSRLGPIRLVRFAYSEALSYYGNGIVATNATIVSKPDLMHRFVQATVQGMKDAFADPVAAGLVPCLSDFDSLTESFG